MRFVTVRSLWARPHFARIHFVSMPTQASDTQRYMCIRDSLDVCREERQLSKVMQQGFSAPRRAKQCTDLPRIARFKRLPRQLRRVPTQVDNNHHSRVLCLLLQPTSSLVLYYRTIQQTSPHKMAPKSGARKRKRLPEEESDDEGQRMDRSCKSLRASLTAPQYKSLVTSTRCQQSQALQALHRVCSAA